MTVGSTQGNILVTFFKVHQIVLVNFERGPQSHCFVKEYPCSGDLTGVDNSFLPLAVLCLKSDSDNTILNGPFTGPFKS